MNDTQEQTFYVIKRDDTGYYFNRTTSDWHKFMSHRSIMSKDAAVAMILSIDEPAARIVRITIKEHKDE